MNPPAPPLDRILMTTDPIGGVWNFCLEVCRGLAPHGIEVILASMGGRVRVEQREAMEALGNVELVETSLRLEWMQEPWHDVAKAGTWLEWLEAQFAPDLVHLSGYAHAGLPWTAPVVVTAHSDVLSWWRAVHGQAAPPAWSVYADAVRAGVRAADIVVAPSRAMLQALEREHGPARESRVIYNGRDPHLYFSNEKEPFILSVGRLWDEAKNARLLGSVAQGLQWPVRLAGDTTGPDGVRVELPNVEPLGHCATERLIGLYSRAAIFALPARYEPFGLSTLEAALSRCALVLGDIPSLREIWEDSALFVDPNDARELRAVLARLIDDPARRDELGRRAQERARQFTAERMVREYLEVYSGVVTASAAERDRTILA